MRIQTFMFATVTLSLFILAMSAFAQSDTGPSQLQNRLLVLKNGHILEGLVTRSVKKLDVDPDEANIHPAARRTNASTRVTYSVKTAQGSRLVIQEADVDFVCATKSEAYWHRNAQIRATDIEAHKALFSWCLKYDMYHQAQNQIEILTLLPIKATELEYIHRQLVIAESGKSNRPSQPAKNSSRPIVQTKPKALVPIMDSPNTTIASQSPPVDTEPDEFAIRELPSITGTSGAEDAFAVRRLPSRDANTDWTPTVNDGNVAQVGFDAPIRNRDESTPQTTKSIGAPETPAKILRAHELDQFTKTVPKPAVAVFKRKIQPMLVRGCMASGCHTRTDSVMPLYSGKSAELIPRRQSQRNLHAIMQLADANEPLASRLLSAASSAHGGMDEAVIKQPSLQFDNLARWLIMVSNKPYSFHELPKRDNATSPILPDEAKPIEPNSEFKPAGETTPAAPTTIVPQPEMSFSDKLDQLANPANKSEPGKRRDGNIFNRRFGKKND